MPKQVIPIRRDSLGSVESQEVADLAFDLWLATGFRGSPEEELFNVVRQLKRKTTVGLFLVPRRRARSE
jgi:hypothetical protein